MVEEVTAPHHHHHNTTRSQIATPRFLIAALLFGEAAAGTGYYLLAGWLTAMPSQPKPKPTYLEA